MWQIEAELAPSAERENHKPQTPENHQRRATRFGAFSLGLLAVFDEGVWP